MADLLGDDPAAEFLQQEEDQLRELGIDENQFDSQSAEVGGEVDAMAAFQADVDIDTPQEPQMNGFAEPAPPVIQMQPTVEPESLKLWREEKAASLKKQEEEEVENHQQWTERAKKELEDWYNHYNEQLDKTRTENKAAEEQFISDMTDSKPGNEWEKTANFCDFNPKNSKNSKDVSRMRSMLLQLKQNPLVRPEA